MPTDRFWILIARKLSGESSVEEIRELEVLLRLHPHLHFSVEIVTNLWNQHAVIDEKQLEDCYSSHIRRMNQMGIAMHQEHKEDDEISFLLQVSRKNRRMRNIAVTASILAIVTVGSLYFFNQKNSSAAAPKVFEGLAAVTTKNGSRTDIQLPDGSKVWLNSGSTITYDKQFGKVIREVVLSGEAFFDVVRNPDKPFIIHTSSMDIKVLGTQFNVKAYANDKLSEATLIHGSIEISLKKRSSEKFLLEPNEKIVVQNESLEIEPIGLAVKQTPSQPIFAVQKLNYKDSSIIETSWIDNKLIFQNESFEDIALKMERWFGVAVTFQDLSLKSERFSGSFTSETIEEALEALQITFSFHYIKRANTIIISK